MTSPFDDARWFPVDLHVPDREFRFLPIDEGVLERSTFLDNRIDAQLDSATPVPLAAIPPQLPAGRLGWLFHTSFCCSTLLARALHLAPNQVVLKEPLLLRRLGDARHSGWPVDDFLRPVVGLLARPWSAAGSVVIKPTHAALNIAADLMRTTPGSRALLLTSSVEDFVVSNIKKAPETQSRIPELAERALRTCTLAARLPPAALAPPDLLCAAALQWAAQRELGADLLRAFGNATLRTLDASQLLGDPVGVARVANAWLGEPQLDTALRARAAAVSTRNAKATAVPYDGKQRERDVMSIRQRFEAPVGRALAWYERHVAPSMSAAARDLPAMAPLGAP
ncbi:hypothetical protein [Cognatilysobacter lacus]|uniref:Uncharacterized protein n=1 Tax=Cognatilysobacter lacus TaxID=1643323 RepID=A0A5D8ZA28_9GAMM|nr:hypothetical protein [Lysobacter lacus]TZF91758.1 hypothetical protein FW784_00470 [Lysobacter lacus]